MMTKLERLQQRNYQLSYALAMALGALKVIEQCEDYRREGLREVIRDVQKLLDDKRQEFTGERT